MAARPSKAAAARRHAERNEGNPPEEGTAADSPPRVVGGQEGAYPCQRFPLALEGRQARSRRRPGGMSPATFTSAPARQQGRHPRAAACVRRGLRASSKSARRRFPAGERARTRSGEARKEEAPQVLARGGVGVLVLDHRREARPAPRPRARRRRGAGAASRSPRGPPPGSSCRRRVAARGGRGEPGPRRSSSAPAGASARWSRAAEPTRPQEETRAGQGQEQQEGPAPHRPARLVAKPGGEGEADGRQRARTRPAASRGRRGLERGGPDRASGGGARGKGRIAATTSERPGHHEVDRAEKGEAEQEEAHALPPAGAGRVPCSRTSRCSSGSSARSCSPTASTKVASRGRAGPRRSRGSSSRRRRRGGEGLPGGARRVAEGAPVPLTREEPLLEEAIEGGHDGGVRKVLAERLMDLAHGEVPRLAPQDIQNAFLEGSERLHDLTSIGSGRSGGNSASEAQRVAQVDAPPGGVQPHEMPR